MPDGRRQGRGGDGLHKKRGIWHFWIRDWNGKRRSLSAQTRNYAEAKARRDKYVSDLREGLEIGSSGRAPFRVAAEEWLQRKSLDAAENTRRAWKARLKNVNSLLGDMPVGRITSDTMRRYQIERRKTMAPASVNAETKLIAGVLLYCRQWTRIRVDFRKLREPSTGGRVLTDDEMARLRAAAEDRRESSHILLVLQMMTCGLRHKELRTLRIGDVNLEHCCLQVRREGTKTDSGVRLVPMGEEAVDAARQLIERAASLGSIEPFHYLFPGSDLVKVPGQRHKMRRPNPLKPQAGFGDAWRSLRDAAGVDPNLRMHDLRHHVATEMAEAGVPIDVADRMMGWSDPSMRRRYQHIQDAALRRGIDQLEAFRRDRRTEASPKTAFPVTSVARTGIRLIKR